MLEVGTIRPPKAADVLASGLRQKILRNGMKVGARLPSERELIEQSGLSRATVREGLRLLEADGLIAIRRGPKGGITVSQPSLHQMSRTLAILMTRTQARVADLFTLRRLLEPPAAGLAARNATPEQRAALNHAVTPASDVGQAVAFHELLAAATGNPLLQVVLEVLDGILHVHASEEDLSAADLAGVGRQHRAVAAAIVHHDAEAASEAMDRHIASFERALSRQGRLEGPIVPGRARREMRCLA
jgi:DNA-binding FadR family transcriptional regulator